MDPFAFVLHLLGLAAPASVPAVLLALLPRLVGMGGARSPRWWVAGLVNLAVGVAVLTAGLVLTGRDGKMATYAALVVAMATSQWLLGRGWQR